MGDAKSFRLSRTAKNAKDFKVTSMAEWKGNSDFAVLVCPYYQYPKSRSQIYGQALNNCFLNDQDEIIRLYLKIEEDNFKNYFTKYKANIIIRGETEIK